MGQCFTSRIREKMSFKTNRGSKRALRRLKRDVQQAHKRTIRKQGEIKMARVKVKYEVEMDIPDNVIAKFGKPLQELVNPQVYSQSPEAFASDVQAYGVGGRTISVEYVGAVISTAGEHLRGGV